MNNDLKMTLKSWQTPLYNFLLKQLQMRESKTWLRISWPSPWMPKLFETKHVNLCVCLAQQEYHPISQNNRKMTIWATFHSITFCSRSFTFALWGLWGLQELQPTNSKRWGSSSLASVTLQVRHNVTLLVRHNHQQLPHLSTFVTSHTSCWAWSNLQKSGLKQSACYIVCILWTFAFYDGYDFLHW